MERIYHDHNREKIFLSEILREEILDKRQMSLMTEQIKIFRFIGTLLTYNKQAFKLSFY
jgi:hypothetical protein